MGNLLKKAWQFIWEENSILSWIVNIALAFVIIKFIVYPGLGFLLATSNPVVAVVSCSMEHSATNCGQNFPHSICGEHFTEHKSLSEDEYWGICGQWYEQKNISKEEFSSFSFSSGFSKGDLMILRGKNIEKVDIGDVLVFQGGSLEPIIHRVVESRESGNQRIIETKGDNNEDQITPENNRLRTDETKILENQLIGVAWIKIPMLGWVKILFTELLSLIIEPR